MNSFLLYLTGVFSGIFAGFFLTRSFWKTNKETELNFYGEITNYKINPISIQSNDIAAKNRLEITIKVKYTNTLDNNQNFEHSFKRYRDFDSEQNLTEIEDDLIQSILEEITEDIYNKAFVNW